MYNIRYLFNLYHESRCIPYFHFQVLNSCRNRTTDYAGRLGAGGDKRESNQVGGGRRECRERELNLGVFSEVVWTASAVETF